ncbi:hypothetical protein ACFSTC_45000 [Nonomuraea ferruginea]
MRAPGSPWVIAGRYKGQKVVAIGPHPTRLSDETLVVRPGTDGALAMAVGHVLLKEFFLDRPSVRRARDGAHRPCLPWCGCASWRTGWCPAGCSAATPGGSACTGGRRGGGDGGAAAALRRGAGRAAPRGAGGARRRGPGDDRVRPAAGGVRAGPAGSAGELAGRLRRQDLPVHARLAGGAHRGGGLAGAEAGQGAGRHGREDGRAVHRGARLARHAARRHRLPGDAGAARAHRLPPGGWAQASGGAGVPLVPYLVLHACGEDRADLGGVELGAGRRDVRPADVADGAAGRGARRAADGAAAAGAGAAAVDLPAAAAGGPADRAGRTVRSGHSGLQTGRRHGGEAVGRAGGATREEPEPGEPGMRTVVDHAWMYEYGEALPVYRPPGVGVPLKPTQLVRLP